MSLILWSLRHSCLSRTRSMVTGGRHVVAWCNIPLLMSQFGDVCFCSIFVKNELHVFALQVEGYAVHDRAGQCLVSVRTPKSNVGIADPTRTYVYGKIFGENPRLTTLANALRVHVYFPSRLGWETEDWSDQRRVLVQQWFKQRSEVELPNIYFKILSRCHVVSSSARGSPVTVNDVRPCTSTDYVRRLQPSSIDK